MPKTTGVSFETELYDEDDNLILVYVEATCHGRRSANMNWGGLPDPPEPAHAELDTFELVEVVEGDIDLEDVDDEELFSSNDESVLDEALEQADSKAQRAQEGPEYDPVEHSRRY